jgi:hypothetical protein
VLGKTGACVAYFHLQVKLSVSCVSAFIENFFRIFFQKKLGISHDFFDRLSYSVRQVCPLFGNQLGFNLDRTIMRVFNGIDDKVCENLLEAVPVGFDLQLLFKVNVALEGDLFGLGLKLAHG